MNMIAAIAMLCQINVGIGSGAAYINTDAIQQVINFTYVKQRNCQNRIVKCLKNKIVTDKYTEQQVIECLE